MNRRDFLGTALAALGMLLTGQRLPQMGGYVTKPWHPLDSDLSGLLSLDTMKQVFGQAWLDSACSGEMSVVIRPELWKELQRMEGFNVCLG